MIIDILLIRITDFEQVDSPFGRYLSSILIYRGYNRLCSICLNQIDRWDDGVSLACDHHYHKKCIDEWFEAQLSSCVANNRDYRLSCPLCRFDPILLDRMISSEDQEVF